MSTIVAFTDPSTKKLKTGVVIKRIDESTVQVKVHDSDEVEPVNLTDIKAVSEPEANVDVAEMKTDGKAVYSPLMVEIFNMFKDKDEFALVPMTLESGFPAFKFSWNVVSRDVTKLYPECYGLEAYIRETPASVDLVVTQPFVKIFTAMKKLDKKHQIASARALVNNFLNMVSEMHAVLAKRRQKQIEEFEAYRRSVLPQVFVINDRNNAMLEEGVSVRSVGKDSIDNDPKFKKYAMSAAKIWSGPIVRELLLSPEQREYIDSLEVVDMDPVFDPVHTQVFLDESGPSDLVMKVNDMKFYAVMDNNGLIKTLYRLK